MRKLITFIIMLGISSFIIAGEPNEGVDIVQNDVQIDEIMKVKNECYQFISEEKYNEAFATLTSLKNNHDKVDILRSIGMSSSDVSVRQKALSQLESLKKSDESLSYLDQDIAQINYKHMTEDKKISFLKSIKDFSMLTHYLHLSMFTKPDNVIAVYALLETLLPKTPTSMDLMTILNSIQVTTDENVTKKGNDLERLVFEKSKTLELYNQVNISIQLANRYIEDNTLYTNHIKSLYSNTSELNDKISIGLQICYNKSLAILESSEFASLENKVIAAMNKNKDGTSGLNSLIQLAECQEDIDKMKELVLKLPEEQRSAIYIPEPRVSETEVLKK